MNIDLHPRTLAYIGDAVYELWVRELMLKTSADIEILHKLTVSLVRAESQADILRAVLPNLPIELQELARRARNNTAPPKGRKIGQKDYRDATALEAVIGHCQLYAPEELARLEPLVMQEVLHMMEKQANPSL